MKRSRFITTLCRSCTPSIRLLFSSSFLLRIPNRLTNSVTVNSRTTKSPETPETPSLKGFMHVRPRRSWPCWRLGGLLFVNLFVKTQ